MVPFVCASFVLVCAAKSFVCAASVSEILDIYFLAMTSSSPPFSSKWTQIGTVRLCFVCARLCSKKFRLCCFRFGDITHLFFSDDVIEPPLFLQMDPNWYRSFVLRLCSFVQQKSSFVLLWFFSYERLFYRSSRVHPAPPFPPNGPKMVPFVCASFVLVCAAKSFVCAASVSEILDIYFLAMTSSSPPFSSKWTQIGTVRLCFVCARLCSKKFRLCCFRFGDITHLFFSDDVIEPPLFLQMDPNWYRSFVLRLCSFVQQKSSFVLLWFFSYERLFYRSSRVHPAPPFPLNGPKMVPCVCASFVLVCAAKIFVCAAFVSEILHIYFLAMTSSSPPLFLQMDPNWYRSFVLRLCWFVQQKLSFVLPPFRRYYTFI
nr:uncharacterized protein LOC125980753 [Syngnathus scovelli]